MKKKTLIAATTAVVAVAVLVGSYEAKHMQSVRHAAEQELLNIAIGKSSHLSTPTEALEMKYVLTNGVFSGYEGTTTGECIGERLENARAFKKLESAPETKGYMAALWTPIPDAKIALGGKAFLLMNTDALEKAKYQIRLLKLALAGKANVAVTAANYQESPTVKIALSETKTVLGQKVEFPLGVITADVSALEKLEGHEALLKKYTGEKVATR